MNMNRHPTRHTPKRPPSLVLSIVLCFTGGDCFLLESIFEAEVWSFMCDPVSEPNEAAVCAAMVEGAREALAGYCSSLEEDLALIRGGTLAPGSRQELAVQVGGWAERTCSVNAHWHRTRELGWCTALHAREDQRDTAAH
jgi:hypothetical protein